MFFRNFSLPGYTVSLKGLLLGALQTISHLSKKEIWEEIVVGDKRGKSERQMRRKCGWELDWAGL